MSDHQGKTFQMRKPRDRLDMLDWEVRQLQGTPVRDAQEVAYRTIHCALSAWHMCDWVFPDLTDELRAKWSAGDSKIPLRRFQEWVKLESPAVKICRELADAIKHRTLDHGPDALITSEQMEWRNPEGGPLWLWALTDAKGISDVRNVARAAYDFWLRLLDESNLTARSPENRRILPDTAMRGELRRQLDLAGIGTDGDQPGA